VYHIDRFNPQSSYHLSLGLNYPNTSDRRFADPEKPGSDIFIHGRASSVGCLAIGDEAIEEVYVLASDVSNGTQHRIPVHIFPARMDDHAWAPDSSDEAGSNPELLAFWENLRPVYTRFEQTRRVPEVTVDDAGRYRLR
jgi:murein L,D-transpeptidase YafK